MSTFIYRLAQASWRAPKRVIAAWFAVLVLLGGLVGVLGAQFDNEFRIPGASSQAALDQPVEEVQERFRARRYIASRRIATVVYLASRMNRPVLVEGPAGVGKTELAKVLVTLFQELRAGVTKDGKTKVKQPGSVLSTAEAISVLFNSGILAQHFGDGAVTPEDLVRSLLGAVAKESHDDVKAVREYCETVAKGRAGLWKEFYSAAKRRLSP